jgi:hypothetical protein
MGNDPIHNLLVNHPAPWTAWFVRAEQRYDLLDANGGVVCPIADRAVANGFARLVNDIARQRAAERPIAQIVALPTSTTVTAPPAPDPLNGTSTTWAELFDHLICLLDDGDVSLLRRLLFDYARVTEALPLPAVITNATTGEDR